MRRLMQCVMLVLLVGVGLVFLLSSLLKLARPYDFLGNLYEYELVGPNIGILIAIILPWLELVVSLCLLGGILTRAASFMVTVLAAIFVFAQISVLHRGLKITCGCFGSPTVDPVNLITVGRTAALFLLGAFGVFGSPLLRRESGEVATKAR